MRQGHSPSGAVCPLCASDRLRLLGVRGTREYFGADPSAEPHLTTAVLRCRRCDFIFADPVHPWMDRLEQAYYSDPDRYSATAGCDSTPMYLARLRMIEEFRSGGALLDVGAGKGEFLAQAAVRGWKVQGVEPSPAFCKYARDRYGLDLHVGTLDEAEAIPLGHFDAVTLNHVLEHVAQPFRLLRTIRGYLKGDGLLFVEVPNCDSYFLRLVDLYFRLRGLKWSSRLSPFHPPFHRFGFTARSLAFLLEREGYGVLRMTTFSGRERGFHQKKSRWHPEVLLRDLASAMLQFVGNRELLTVVARLR